MDEAQIDDAGVFERRYANFLRVGFNLSEFLLDFAQLYADGPEAVHTHLVASPVHLKQFVELMQGCVADYEQRYGAIALPSEP